MSINDNLSPIGVFDSGIGGLTVVNRIAQELPNENVIYFGDTARVPYGSKSNAAVIEYSLQNAAFLMSKKVKLIVVACNTASSVALDEIRRHFNVPVIGMIEPGAAFAINSTSNGRIGVIGTRATINNHAYSIAIKNLNPSTEVFETACPLFVPLAEEGWIDHKAAYLIAEEYLKELKVKNIDTLVLGCTHYPILAPVIQKIIGFQVNLIDSGIASARKVKFELDQLGILSSSSVPGLNEYYVSDIPQKFIEVAALFFGKKIESVIKIDLEYLQNLQNLK